MSKEFGKHGLLVCGQLSNIAGLCGASHAFVVLAQELSRSSQNIALTNLSSEGELAKIAQILEGYKVVGGQDSTLVGRNDFNSPFSAARHPSDKNIVIFTNYATDETIDVERYENWRGGSQVFLLENGTPVIPFDAIEDGGSRPTHRIFLNPYNGRVVSKIELNPDWFRMSSIDGSMWYMISNPATDENPELSQVYEIYRADQKVFEGEVPYGDTISSIIPNPENPNEVVVESQTYTYEFTSDNVFVSTGDDDFYYYTLKIDTGEIGLVTLATEAEQHSFKPILRDNKLLIHYVDSQLVFEFVKEFPLDRPRAWHAGEVEEVYSHLWIESRDDEWIIQTTEAWFVGGNEYNLRFENTETGEVLTLETSQLAYIDIDSNEQMQEFDGLMISAWLVVLAFLIRYAGYVSRRKNQR